MRMYIRHPFDVTMHYLVEEAISDEYEHERTLKDLSEGGLCFQSPDPVRVGSRIHINIPVEDPAFEAEGVVAWCRKSDHYEIGVQFDSNHIEYNLRMVEQACYIKQYLKQQEKLGRLLTTNEAAQEWIHMHAADFPR